MWTIHEGILHGLALFYFQCGCRLARCYTPPLWGWDDDYEYSHRARKHLEPITAFEPSLDKVRSIFERLEFLAHGMNFNLSADLAADLRDTADHLERNLNFLEDNDPRGVSRKKVIIDCQNWAFAYSERGRKLASDAGFNNLSGKEYLQWIAKNHSCPIKSDPTRRWRERAAKLAKTENPHAALQNYHSFMKQTESFREAIGRAVDVLHYHVFRDINAPK